MRSKRFWFILSALFITAMVLSACGGAAEEVVETEVPTQLRIAAVTITPIEEPWNTSWLQTMERLQASKPHDLEITLTFTENVLPPDAERVLRQYAETGEYDMIFAHSSFSEAVDAMNDDYPELIFGFTGSGNQGVGGNAYWLDILQHESAYLLGVLAAAVSETGTVGAVASFPFPNVNSALNALSDGAKSVNPDVDIKVTYIESWFDPPTAAEAARAQVAAGADVIYADVFGPFTTCLDLGCWAFGNYVDQYEITPEVVLSSNLVRWDPGMLYMIDAWWAFKTEGTAFDAPLERVSFTMAEGGADIAPYYDLESEIPQEALDIVAEVKATIMDGSLVIPVNEVQLDTD
jgi:basic membrane protein A and related proteins